MAGADSRFPPLPDLPINSILPSLLEKMTRYPSAILKADPGSGKTTIVPLILSRQPWMKGKKILLLAPRRLAARAAAQRLSELAGSALGEFIGYRIRFESRVSKATRIEVVTEGVLIRMVQNNPELADTGLVIFDEFHERRLQSDLALALCLDARQLRDDLKILVMSATLDTAELSTLLDDTPIISGRGRSYPVEVHYLPRRSRLPVVERTRRSIERALAEHAGDILVFLPGAGEIRSLQKQFADRDDFDCLPLYGDLPWEQQRRIFAPHPARRRVILATPIAETSLTIEGITTVIDSGLFKSPRFDPASGLTRLETLQVSRASARQRCGRAGRTGPGVCYRLWTREENHSRPAFLPPEIHGADLAPLVLELAMWGVSEPKKLRWLDPPRSGQVQQAREVLLSLGAVDDQYHITPLGRKLALLPLHPRLALMLINGRKQGIGLLAGRVAAILNNRDPLSFQAGYRSAALEDRLELLDIFDREGKRGVRRKGGDPEACSRILREAKRYLRLVGSSTSPERSRKSAGTILAQSFPERVCQKIPGSSQYLLASGQRVSLPEIDHLAGEKYLVAARLDRGQRTGKIFLAADICLEELEETLSHRIMSLEQVQWDSLRQRVTATRKRVLGNLSLTSSPWPDPPSELVTGCLLEGVSQLGIGCLPWQKKDRELQARMQSVQCWYPDQWPDVSDQKLEADLSWLEPYLTGFRNLQDLKELDPGSILLSFLSWKQQQEMDRIAPTHLQVASGSRIRLTYQPGKAPILAVRIQELFGSTETPVIGDGEVPVLLHLLSPAMRPVQITSDLAAFWKTTYPEVKKELAGRYPKHFWPEDPRTAEATSRAKPRK